MNLLKKLFVAAALASASLSAHALEAHIQVWADVDPTLALLKADGTALDDVVKLEYRPGPTTTGSLVPWSDSVRIFSNDVSKDVQVRLIQAAVLQAQIGTGTAVPLTVSLKGKPLTITAQDFTAAELFTGSIPGASVEMPLEIRQTTPATITAAGRYEGLVSIAMVQKP